MPDARLDRAAECSPVGDAGDVRQRRFSISSSAEGEEDNQASLHRSATFRERGVATRITPIKMA